MQTPINLFYFEPFDDRWIALDRYPRKLARTLLRTTVLSGYVQTFRMLQLGLKRAGIPFRVNDFRHASRRPEEPLGILGKNDLLDRWRPENPMVCGPIMLDHPKDRIDLFEDFNCKFYLVKSAWVGDMFAPYFGDRVQIWPVGIDVETWPDQSRHPKDLDFLVYEKFLWDQEANKRNILAPILEVLKRRKLTYALLHYGSYTHNEYKTFLQRARYMIFLCEHETQGHGYLQALASDVPILAWDQGFWLDPKAKHYERKLVPSSSVPYFAQMCGVTFRRLEEFETALESLLSGNFAPRKFVIETFNIVDCARRYAAFVRRAAEQPKT